MPRVLNLLIAAGALLLATVPVGAGATAYNKIVVFGDSQSDVGNFYLATGRAWPASPYYQGRFSNDWLWVEHLASTYGLANLTPNTDTSTPSPGTDYAFAHAHVLTSVTITPPAGTTVQVPRIGLQVKQYLLDVAHKADPNALYIIWGGEEDLIDAVENATPLHATKLGADIANMVGELKAAGATDFMIPTIPDIEYLPEIVGLGLASAAHGQAHIYNASVGGALANPTLAAGITVLRPNLYRLQRSIITATTHYGFTDITDACLTGTPPHQAECSDPQGTLFWDGRYFSQWFQGLMAGGGQAVIPAARGVPFP